MRRPERSAATYRSPPTNESGPRAADPRPSIRERYPTRASYVRAIAAACERLVRERLLLEEDADRYVELAMRDRVLD